MPETPRPDQRLIASPPYGLGSRSGAGDLAGALGYPGIPSAVVNCQSAQLLHQGTGVVSFFTFTAPGRIWTVALSYVITSNPSFSLATAKTYAQVKTSTGLTLAAIDLGVANSKQAANGQSEPPIPGLPVTQGTSLILDINGGTLITNLDQQASAIVLYSIP